MSKKTKIWLIIASSLIVIGSILFGGVMTMFKWDFKKLSTIKYETNEYEINDAFQAITVNANVADISFAPSKDGTCRVVCYEQKKVTHTVEVQDGTLIIDTVDSRKWYEYIDISFRAPKITVSLPEADYGSAVIETSTGDIHVKALSIEEMKISTSTGNIKVSNVVVQGDVQVEVSTGETKLSDVKCKNFISTGSTGDVSLDNTIAAETISIKRSTGDIIWKEADAKEIFAKTSTGNILGSLLSDKVFVTHTSTGNINVPETLEGGKCELRTSTGNIKMTINSSSIRQNFQK